MSDDHPIKLTAAAKEFGMSICTLRAQYDKGNLVAYKIGKHLWTKRKHVFEMVELCRVDRKARGSISIRNDETGLSETDHISSARAALNQTLTARGKH
jgi:hypothetical protein